MKKVIEAILIKRRFIIVSIILLASCGKEEVLTTPSQANPTKIIINASVPQAIYSNRKQVKLDASLMVKKYGAGVLKYLWTCSSYPAGKIPVIKDPNSAVAIADSLVTGKYKFILNVRDSYYQEVISEYNLVVYQDTLTGPPVLPPLNDKVYTLPEPVFLFANDVFSVNPADRVLNFKWELLAQPSGSPQIDIRSETQNFTEVMGCIEGNYLFRLELSNELGLKIADTFNVRVISDKLAGTTRIYDNLTWKSLYDDFDNKIIVLIVEDSTITFNGRNTKNADVSLWDSEKQDWMVSNTFNWEGESHGLYIYNNINLDNIKEGTYAKVKIRFK